MYWKYSLGFLIASLVQAAIIAASEYLGISTLGARITFGQLIIHILAGQAVGFLLMVIMQGIKGIAETNFWLLGSIYGAIVWVILVSINSAQGTINAPWTQGASTIIVSLLAFVVYGITVTYTIKKYGDLGAKD
ncbi:MAG: hypothetical protein PHZ11_09110 [Desulfitobacteriaceae bacterium]|nr:hypothetical protein [Desulfitobacteriaceae bacterium]MDD4347021.1 hypothetical protein [Desulfitobacteriaceae bacterium]MDD4402093.1 hypothetical protein [Desulfitobacteriaceae bacterium]